jgi:hypothetical protein
MEQWQEQQQLKVQGIRSLAAAKGGVRSIATEQQRQRYEAPLWRITPLLYARNKQSASINLRLI